jgi:acyl-CoA thioesterase FadM
MSAAAMTPSRLTMSFQYFRLGPGGEEELVAEGEQEVACMHRTDDRMEPAPLPQALRDAVELYMRPPAASSTSLAVTL